MFKLQRLVLNIASVVLLLMAVFLIIQNLSTHVSVQFFTMSWRDVSLGLLLVMVGLLIAGSFAAKLWERILMLGKQTRQVSRELEKQGVSREESQAKVKALEAKIATLEKALQEAFKQS